MSINKKISVNKHIRSERTSKNSKRSGLAKKDEKAINIISGGSGIVRRAKSISGFRIIMYYNAGYNFNNDSYIVIKLMDAHSKNPRTIKVKEFLTRSKTAKGDAVKEYEKMR